MNLRGRKFLLPAEDLYEDMELHYPRFRLQEEGAQVIVAGPAAANYMGKRGYPVTCDFLLKELKSGFFDGVIVPGGFAPDKLRADKDCLRLVKDVFDRGGLVAAVCHAPWVLISAGIVRGKRMTSVARIKDDLVNAGAVWEDREVVVDGNLISSRTPADLPAFMRAILEWIRAH